MYDARIADNDGVGRDVAIDITVGGNKHIIAHSNTPHHHGTHAYPHTRAYHRAALALSTILLPDGNSLVYVTVCTDDDLAVNGNIEGMTKIKAVAYAHVPRYFQPVVRTIISEHYAAHKAHQRHACGLRQTEPEEETKYVPPPVFLLQSFL